jgi:hypothetical protein
VENPASTSVRAGSAAANADARKTRLLILSPTFRNARTSYESAHATSPRGEEAEKMAGSR